MLVQQIINGLTVGTTYALVAVGFSMVYSVLELANFANGAFYVFAPYMVVLLYASIGWGFVPAFLIAVFGSATRSLPNAVNIGRIYIRDAIMTGNQLVIIATSVVIMVVLSVIVYKTKLGSAMRSIAQSSVASRMMSVNVNRIITVTFFIGSVSAAIAGILVAMYYGSVDTTLYTTVSVKTFASAILGGLIIGMVETFVAGYVTSAYKDMIVFIIIIVFLIFQPNLDLLKRIVELNQGEDLVYWTLFTPWNHARAMTRDNTIVNAHTYSRHPAFEDALKRLEDAVIRQADIFFDACVDGMYYASRGSELNRFEDDIFQRYVKRYDLGVLNYINTRSRYNIFHMCGDNLRMEQYRDYECAAINWDIHGNNLPLQQGRAMFGRKVMGGLDNLAAISNGTPEETRPGDLGRAGVLWPAGTDRGMRLYIGGICPHGQYKGNGKGMRHLLKERIRTT